MKRECDSCGGEFDEKDMNEHRFYGTKTYVCKKCAAEYGKG